MLQVFKSAFVLVGLVKNTLVGIWQFFTENLRFSLIKGRTRNFYADVRCKLLDLYTTNFHLCIYHYCVGNIGDAIIRLKFMLRITNEDKKGWIYFLLALCYRKISKNQEFASYLNLANENVSNSYNQENLSSCLDFFYKVLDEDITNCAYPSLWLQTVYDVFSSSGYVSRIIVNKKYKAHLVAFDSIVYFFHHRLTGLRILDLGCGTGIAAQYFKMCRLTVFITGVDISSNMLEIADKVNLNGKRVLDEIVNEDLRTFIQNPQKKRYDLVMLVDVLSYIGEFETVLHDIVQNTLSANGAILLTLEIEEENKLHVIKDEPDRLVFSESYLLSTVKKSGLEIEYSIDITLREGIKSILIILKKHEF